MNERNNWDATRKDGFSVYDLVVKIYNDPKDHLWKVALCFGDCTFIDGEGVSVDIGGGVTLSGDVEQFESCVHFKTKDKALELVGQFEAMIKSQCINFEVRENGKTVKEWSTYGS